MDRLDGRLKLTLVAVAASTVALAGVASYNSYSKRKRREKLTRDVKSALAQSDADAHGSKPPRPELLEGHHPQFRDEITKPFQGEYSEDLIREQLVRNYAFFPDGGMDKIRAAKIVIVGCGGVGSWAAVMLARSGVSDLRLVDFDYVTLSSLNRHATATLADVGTPKVKSVERAITSFAPWVKVDPRVELWNKETEDSHHLLQGADWVVEAIDNITTKVELLKYCHSHAIKVFSSMGAGTKSDPTRIQIADISETIYDPLARSVRRRLRLEGVAFGIPVVYSTEVPGDVKLLPLPEEEFQKGDVKELGVLDGFRVRILPVLGPLPAIFGLNIATYLICDLAGKPILNPLAIKNRRKVYEKLHKDLTAREAKYIDAARTSRLPIDDEDVAFIFEDLNRGRATLPPHANLAKPCLIRWDLNQPLTLTNCVVMNPEDAAKHEEEWRAGKSPESVWGEEAANLVRRRQREAQEWQDAIL